MAQPAPVVADLIKDIEGVEKKFVGLAKVTPAEKMAWCPRGRRTLDRRRVPARGLEQLLHPVRLRACHSGVDRDQGG
jgi:hypothetical protein